MTSILERNVFCRGESNNYLLAGNICNAFALGDVGSADDFFLIGAEPEQESVFPSITGNILDSEGKLLLRLVRNVVVFNPRDCSRVFGDLRGYEIHDSAGLPILAVRTQFSEADGFVTTIRANFYDRHGTLVFHANSGDRDERIESSVPSLFGFTGGSVGISIGYSAEQFEAAKTALATHGRVSQRLTGEIVDQDVVLDGKLVRNAQLRRCRIVIETGDFLIQDVVFDKCTFDFRGSAMRIAEVARQLTESIERKGR